MLTPKVLFITQGSEKLASSRTRVYQYLPFLQAVGIQYKVFPILEWSPTLHAGTKQPQGNLQTFLERRLSWARQILAILTAKGYDVVFIQKVLLPPALLDVLAHMGKPYLFDLDDAIYATHQYYRDERTLLAWLRARWKFITRRRLRHVIGTSQCVVLENDDTKEFASQFNQNILVITGPIDITRYSPRATERGDGRVVIGWIGSPPNTIYLQPIYGVFQRLAQAYPQVVFEFIGAQPFELPGVELRFTQWTLETEVENLHRFDIGIMPVPDDEWSRGKGGYKLLQYMALGIPSVASPVGINSKLLSHGETGYLVSTEEEWFQKLEELVVNAQLRQSMGQKARDLAASRYSFQVAAPRFIAALRAAVGDKSNL